MAGEGNNKGWISIYRNIQEHWLWQEKPFDKARAWIDLLLLANHQDNKFLLGNEIMQVDRGSFVTSEMKLVERWGWSKTKVRNFLDVLQKDNMITKISDKKKTTITIVNYSIYQELKTTEIPQKDHARTTKEPCKDTNNNDNNVNNDNNDNKYICESNLDDKAIELCKYYETLLPGRSITQYLVNLKIFINDYGFDLTKEAIQKTVSNKGKFIKPYTEKILKDWTVNGKEDIKGGGIKQNPKPEQRNIGPSEETLRLEEIARREGRDRLQDIKCDF